MREWIRDRPLMALINVLPWMSHREHYLKSMLPFSLWPWSGLAPLKALRPAVTGLWCSFEFACLHRGLMQLNYIHIFCYHYSPLPSTLIINWITVMHQRKVNPYVTYTITIYRQSTEDSVHWILIITGSLLYELIETVGCTLLFNKTV